MTSSVRYLPTSKFHILPIRGLSPEQLKQSAKTCMRDRETIRHNTLLNLLAKQMGFKGGFAGFAQEYERSLVPFMQAHGLRKQTDLLIPRLTPEDIPLLELSVEQVSDYLFKSGETKPEKIFTGYNFDYTSRYDDVEWDYNCWARTVLGEIPLPGSEGCIQLLKDACSYPNKIEQGTGRKLVDLVLGGGLFEQIRPIFNLLGGLLKSTDRFGPVVPELYWVGDYDPEARKRSDEAFELACGLFHKEITADELGWVDVLPYNESLIFLRGEDGQYDFLIKGLRANSFNHQIYAPYLRRADVPSQMNDEYHFQRWYYFEYEGWREWDEHHAEQHFYDVGGSVKTYPGKWSVLRTYFEKQGVFNPLQVKHSSQTALPFDVHLVQFETKALYVSDLIPISEVIQFSNRNPEYFEARKQVSAKEQFDNLWPMNRDSLNLPAAVTWFDACAYLRYLGTQLN